MGYLFGAMIVVSYKVELELSHIFLLFCPFLTLIFCLLVQLFCQHFFFLFPLRFLKGVCVCGGPARKGWELPERDGEEGGCVYEIMIFLAKVRVLVSFPLFLLCSSSYPGYGKTCSRPLVQYFPQQDTRHKVYEKPGRTENEAEKAQVKHSR